MPDAGENSGKSGGTRNELNGNVRGNAFQIGHVHGNINLHTASSKSSAKNSSSDDTDAFFGCLGCSVLVIVLIVIVLLVSMCGRGSDIPDESDPWPPGAKADRVLATVVDGLRSCARAVVLEPANCPQAESSPGSEVSDVEWKLHGFPEDGARIVYHESRFHVYGTAVMTVAYKDVMGSSFYTVEAPYLAEVSQDGTGLLSMKAREGEPPHPVLKRDPGVRDEEAARVLRAAFDRCVATPRSPMGPECPVSGIGNTPATDDGRWSLVGDPALNTRRQFDPGTGLISVVGSYAATFEHEGLFSERLTTPKNGNYRAKLMAGADGLEVLQIESCVDCGG
ncbi:hypothetical protein [Saccharopolyspora taberi]|uniref:Uncharacterized protein n=1 Tax=Saccharopolyspora taberi TaxID=60895 RepID=A0ABN3V4B5_9PSEU